VDSGDGAQVPLGQEGNVGTRGELRAASVGQEDGTRGEDVLDGVAQTFCTTFHSTFHSPARGALGTALLDESFGCGHGVLGSLGSRDLKKNTPDVVVGYVGGQPRPSPRLHEEDAGHVTSRG
jgi:hypothetical protein